MNTATPTVSVLVTAYNREKYIAASLDSVLAQQFTDFEVIVTDNQSTDGTVAVAREFARRDSRVRVVVNERNLGQFGNRNHAATLARGKYIKYHDSDDLMYPHCLSVMVPLLEAEPRAGFALSTGWAWTGGPTPMLVSPRQCYQREFLGFGMFMCGPACGLFRREVLADLGGFPEMGAPSDHLFWLHACARTSVLLLPADLFWYRMHPGQELSSERALREYAVVAGAAWAALGHEQCPLDGDELHRARINQTWNLVRQLRRDLRAGRIGLFTYRLRHSGLTWSDWCRYLRRPSRNGMAGTPLDRQGDYLVPDWLTRP